LHEQRRRRRRQRRHDLRRRPGLRGWRVCGELPPRPGALWRQVCRPTNRPQLLRSPRWRYRKLYGQRRRRQRQRGHSLRQRASVRGRKLRRELPGGGSALRRQVRGSDDGSKLLRCQRELHGYGGRDSMRVWPGVRRRNLRRELPGKPSVLRRQVRGSDDGSELLRSKWKLRWCERRRDVRIGAGVRERELRGELFGWPGALRRQVHRPRYRPEPLRGLGQLHRRQRWPCLRFRPSVRRRAVRGELPGGSSALRRQVHRSRY
jgi:hypothetical protein